MFVSESQTGTINITVRRYGREIPRLDYPAYFGAMLAAFKIAGAYDRLQKENGIRNHNLYASHS
jgi:hypothetical protein